MASFDNIRLQDEIKLLRARLRVAVDALEAVAPHCYQCPERARAEEVVRGERELMRTPKVVWR